MDTRRVKFATGIAILLGATVWLAMSGYDESKAYYKMADEYVLMSQPDQERRIRLMGEVVEGTIDRADGLLTFTVEMNGAEVAVVYDGTDPVPDTFQDGASVLVEGSRGNDGRFAGKKIQAKCASKYEVDPATAFEQAQASQS